MVPRRGHSSFLSVIPAFYKIKFRRNNIMTNEKNTLVTQTDSQRSPGMARPEDFAVNPPETNKDYPFHGQLGNSAKQCAGLLNVGPKSRGEQNTDKGKSSIESRIEKEQARENLASTKYRR
jgi:hypothetical protein